MEISIELQDEIADRIAVKRIDTIIQTIDDAIYKAQLSVNIDLADEIYAGVFCLTPEEDLQKLIIFRQELTNVKNWCLGKQYDN